MNKLYINIEDMQQTLYINIEDMQKTGWALGVIGTWKDWREMAMSWAFIDSMEEVYEFLKSEIKGQDLIDYISDIWEINIVEFDENNKEHIYLRENRGKF
jgi:hypothetical protein